MAINNGRAPLIPQGWMRAIIFCAAFILVTWAIGILVGLAFATTGGSTNPEDLGTYYLVGMLVTVVISVALTIVFRLIVDRKSLVSLGFHPHLNRNDTWVGLLLAIVLLGIGSSILYLADAVRWVDARADGAEFFISLMLMLAVAVGEEMVFRGYLLNNLMESFDKKLALLFSAALFTFAHIFNPEISALALVNIFLGGLLLGLNYIYTKTLWFAIGFHFGWNFIQGHVLGFAVSGIPEQPMLTQELNGNPLLTGGQFGFEGSFVATAVLAIAIAVFYYVYETKNAEIIVAN